MSPIDLRHLIYKDIGIRGVSRPRVSAFAVLVDLTARGLSCHPAAATYPLRALVPAYQEFVKRQHVGKIVLTVE